MNTAVLTRARQLWLHDAAPRSTARHNMRAWVRSIRHLGDRHILAAANAPRKAGV